MGSIVSSVLDLAKLEWTTLRKGQVTKAKRVLLIENGILLIELENSQLVVLQTSMNRATALVGPFAHINYGLTEASQRVLNALVLFGIITKDQMKAHINKVKTQQAIEERQYHIERLKTACKNLGIECPTVEGHTNDDVQ